MLSEADKDVAIVVMHTDHYFELAQSHLSDPSTYSKLTSDPTPDICSALTL